MYTDDTGEDDESHKEKDERSEEPNIDTLFNQLIGLPEIERTSYKEINAWIDIDSIYGIFDYAYELVGSLNYDLSSWTVCSMLKRKKNQTSSRFKTIFEDSEKKRVMPFSHYQNVDLFYVNIGPYRMIMNYTLVSPKKTLTSTSYFTSAQMRVIVSLLNLAKQEALYCLEDYMEDKDDDCSNEEEVEMKDDEMSSESESEDEKKASTNDNEGNKSSSDEDEFSNDEEEEMNSDGPWEPDEGFETENPNDETMAIGAIEDTELTDIDTKIVELLKTSMTHKMKSTIQSITSFDLESEKSVHKKNGVEIRSNFSCIDNKSMMLIALAYRKILKKVATKRIDFESDHSYWTTEYVGGEEDVGKYFFQEFAKKLYLGGKFLLSGKNFKSLTIGKKGQEWCKDVWNEHKDSSEKELSTCFQSWYKTQVKICHKHIGNYFEFYDSESCGCLYIDIGLNVKNCNKKKTMLIDLKEGSKELKKIIFQSQKKASISKRSDNDQVDSIFEDEEKCLKEAIHIDEVGNDKSDIDIMEGDFDEALNADNDDVNEENKPTFDYRGYFNSIYSSSQGLYPQYMTTEYGNISCGSVPVSLHLEDVCLYDDTLQDELSNRDRIDTQKVMVYSVAGLGACGSCQLYIPHAIRMLLSNVINNMDKVQGICFHGCNILLPKYSPIEKEESVEEMISIMNILNHLHKNSNQIFNFQDEQSLRLETYNCFNSIINDDVIPDVDILKFARVTEYEKFMRTFLHIYSRNYLCIKKIFGSLSSKSKLIPDFSNIPPPIKVYIIKCLEYVQMSVSPIKYHGPITRQMWDGIKSLKYFDVPIDYRVKLPNIKYYKDLKVPYGMNVGLMSLPKLNNLPSMNEIATRKVQYMKQGALQVIKYNLDEECKKRELPFLFKSVCQSTIHKFRSKCVSMVSYVEGISYIRKLIICVTKSSKYTSYILLYYIIKLPEFNIKLHILLFLTLP